MPTNQTTTEQFALEGILSLPGAVSLGVVLVLVFVGMLYRERALLGSRWTLSFVLLRTMAAATVLWMLLGPTLQTKHETSTPHTIALIIDDSGSMDSHDAFDSSHSVRWAAAEEDSGQMSALASTDRAAVALGAAIKQWNDVIRSLGQHRDPDVVAAFARSTKTRVQRAREHVAAADKQLQENAWSSRLERIASELKYVAEDLIPKSLRPLETATIGNIERISLELVDELDEVREQLERSQIRGQRLAYDLATQLGTEQPTHGSLGSRRERVARLLNHLESDVLATVSDSVRVQRYRFSDLMTPVKGIDWNAALQSESESGQSDRPTNLTDALTQVALSAGGQSLVGALLITDGGHNMPGTTSPRDIVASLDGVPINVVPIGGSRAVCDVLIESVDAPPVVVHKDSLVFIVTITAFQSAGESTELVMRQNGKEIRRRTISFQTNRENQREVFDVPADELGSHKFEVSIRPIDDESSEANNVSVSSVKVVTGRTKVLLAERRPRWEYRYLDQLFNRDERIESDQLLFEPRLIATGKRRATGQLPQNVEEYSQYDVVVLGDLSPEQFSDKSQSALAEYVRDRGGNVIVIAGRDHMPSGFDSQTLHSLLPVQRGKILVDRKQAHTVRLTSEGRNNDGLMIADTRSDNTQRWTQVFGKQPIYFISEFSRPKPAAHTLIETVPVDGPSPLSDDDEAPAFLSWHQVGAGKVVFLSSPASYHLRFRRGDRMHHRFWGQMIRWVNSSRQPSASDLVRVSTDSIRYRTGQPVAVTVRLSDPGGAPVQDASVTVEAMRTDDVGTSIDLDLDDRVPGRYTGTFEALSPGAYRLMPRGDEVARLLEGNESTNSASSLDKTNLEIAALINVVEETSLEMANTACDRPLLRAIAEATGGLVVPPTAADEILRLSVASPTVTESIQREPLWNQWRYLWIVFGCVFTEWVVRKSKGLL